MLSPENLSLIAIREMMNLHRSGGVSDGMNMARAFLKLERSVEMEYKVEICKKNDTLVPLAMQAWAGESNMSASNRHCDLYVL